MDTTHPEIAAIARRMAVEAADMERRSVSRIVPDRDPAAFLAAAEREYREGPQPVPPHEHLVAWGVIHGGRHVEH